MCLSIAVKFPDTVLLTGEAHGYEFAVTHNQIGFRCGYIRVPAGHPWHGKDYDSVEAYAHGGLTFSQPDYHCGKGGADNGWWFGFDCAHYMDAQDPSLPTEYAMPSFRSQGTVRTTEYVRDECIELCRQAHDAAHLVYES